MGVMQVLSRLDAVVLPRLARGARRIGRFSRRSPGGPLTAFAVGLGVVVTGVLVAQSVVHPRAIQADQSARVGVTDGELIVNYLAESRDRLAELTATAPDRPVYALVSFTSYLTPDAVTSLVRMAVATTGADSSGQLTTAYAKARVQVPHRQTQVVTLSADQIPDDLVATMLGVANAKDAEAAQDEAVNRPGGPDRVGAQLARTEAAAYRNRCACIFALIVRGVPASLNRLAAQKYTRVVDPAPQVINPSPFVTAYLPPLPEQSDLVTPVAESPDPSGTP
jgi:hypothetical protein